jgi:hypothetical protein
MANSFLTTVLSSVAVSTALAGLLLWLLKSWIAERLKNALKFEYDQKLEAIKLELATLKEDRTRKLEKMLAYYERQIEEFYGPLWNMIHQLYVCNETKDKLVERLDPERTQRVHEYYQAAYFRPVHDEIRSIIKTKLYLVDGVEMPDSFYSYLRHATQERDQRELANNQHIDTSNVKGVPWPADFHRDIKRGFDTAMRRYEECLNGLRLN